MIRPSCFLLHFLKSMSHYLKGTSAVLRCPTSVLCAQLSDQKHMLYKHYPIHTMGGQVVFEGPLQIRRLNEITVLLPDMFQSFLKQKALVNPHYEVVKADSEAWIQG